MTDQLEKLFTSHLGEVPLEITPLRPHASAREIYRLRNNNFSCIGVLGSDLKENKAFIYFTHLFLSYSLPVPQILVAANDSSAYLIEDLGDLTLYDHVVAERNKGGSFSSDVEAIYACVMQLLPLFQIKTSDTVDYRNCHKSQEYGERDFLGDMHSFRDNFLSRIGAVYSESQLEKDFQSFAKYLDKASKKYLLYRDFQARNIMLRNGQPFFLDYQSARRGALQFDVVSILFQSQVGIPTDSRERLLAVYLDAVNELIDLDRSSFMDYFYGFIFMRLMQVLGAYGKLGLEQKREYFLFGIPKAIDNLVAALNLYGLPISLLELQRVFNLLVYYDPEKQKV